MALPDFTTAAAVQAALSGFNLSAGEIAYLPTAVTAASGAVRQWLGGQNVTRGTYDQILRPTPDGYVFLRQQPAFSVSRVCGGRTQALSVTNNDTVTNQWATVAYTYSGDAAEGGATTGLVLTRSASGTIVTDAILWSSLSPPTLGSLVSAIIAKGGGWTALAPAQFARWGVTDLIGSDATAADGISGASLDVFSQTLANVRLRQPGYYLDLNGASPSYGPAAGSYPFFGGTFFLSGDNRIFMPMVRVIYDAGYSVVPPVIVEATTEAAKLIIERLRVFSLMKSEQDGAYQYTLAGPELIEAISCAVRQQLAYYKVSWIG